MRGSYLLGDQTERWTTTLEAQGIRYRSNRDDGDSFDLLIDAVGRVARLEVVHDGWLLRGGAVGEELLWTRGEERHHARAVGFTGRCPAYDLAVVTMLGLQVGESTRVALVEISEPVGGARTVEHGWARTADPDEGVQRFEVADLQTAERWVLHVSGQVLVSRDGRQPAVLSALDPAGT